MTKYKTNKTIKVIKNKNLASRSQPYQTTILNKDRYLQSDRNKLI